MGVERNQRFGRGDLDKLRPNEVVGNELRESRSSFGLTASLKKVRLPPIVALHLDLSQRELVTLCR